MLTNIKNNIIEMQTVCKELRSPKTKSIQTQWLNPRRTTHFVGLLQRRTTTWQRFSSSFRHTDYMALGGDIVSLRVLCRFPQFFFERDFLCKPNRLPNITPAASKVKTQNLQTTQHFFQR